jgi:hypothetical protein
MASRFAKKPDPAIKKNVLRSRAAARNAKNAHASVVVTSLIGTIFAWALFTHQDAQALEAAREANSNQSTLTIATPAQSSTTIESNSTPSTGLFAVTNLSR